MVNYYFDIKIVIYHPFLALSVSDGKLLPINQIHNLPLGTGSTQDLMVNSNTEITNIINLPSIFTNVVLPDKVLPDYTGKLLL